MNKLALFGGGAVIAIAAAAVPYYVGIKAEHSLEAEHARLSKEVVLPGLQLSLSDYQRGWFKSEAVTSINFTPEAKGAQTIHLEIHHHISHLPNLAHGAIATVTSELVLPPQIQDEANRILQGKSPLTTTAYLKFSGAKSYVISSPVFKTTLKDNQTQIDWKGIEGSGEQSSDNAHITTKFSMPGLTITNPQFTMSLDSINYDIESTRGSYDLWFGTANASLKSLTVKVNAPSGDHNIAINDVHIVSDQKERGAVTDGVGSIQVGKSAIDDVTIDSAVYDIELRNLDTKTLHDLQETMRQTYASGDPSQISMAFLGAMPALLKAKPEFNIKRLEFKSSLGNFNGSLHLAFVGEWNDSLAGNPLALLGMINANVDLTMSKSLLTTVAKAEMRDSIVAMAHMQGEELSEKDIDAKATDRATAQLAMMESNGYLVQQDDNYTTKINFENGQLSINGKLAKDFAGGAMQ